MKTGFCLLVFSLCCVAVNAQFKYYEQGIDAYQAKDYSRAIKNLNAYLDYATRNKTFDVEVHYYLALSYFKTQSYTSAVREFDEALQLGHKNAAHIHWFMAKGYSELNVPKQSVEEYTKALEVITDKPNQSKLYYERSQQYVKLGEMMSAREDLHTALTLDSSSDKIKKALSEMSGGDLSQNKQDVIVASKSDASENVRNEKERNEVKQDRIQEDQARTKKETHEPALVGAPAVDQKKEEPTLADIYKDEKRYALVIGNADYKNVAPLKNAANDANDMAIELEKSGFEVIKVINGNYDAMRDAYRKFHEKLANGPKDQTVGLFYYAGHGLQNEGENYLVPVEASIQYEDDIPRVCFAVQRVVVANMERSNSRMNIIILDACRNNPFPSAYRTTASGLAEIRRAKGSFIAFATAPGYTASDGEGRNGLYTQELLKAMRKPGKTIEQVFKDVRLNVMTLSGDKQFTWDQSNIIGDFYFRF